MPRPAIGIGVRIGRRPRPDAPPAGHRARPPGRRRSRPVGGESARGRRVRSILRLPLQPPRPLRSAAARPRATTGSRHNRFGRCGKQQLLRVARKHFELQVKTVFNAALQRRCGGKPESVRQFGRSQPAGQLQQCERVTAGFSEDPVTHLLGISSRSQLDQRRPAWRPGRRLAARQPGSRRGRHGRALASCAGHWRIRTCPGPHDTTCEEAASTARSRGSRHGYHQLTASPSHPQTALPGNRPAPGPRPRPPQARVPGGHHPVRATPRRSPIGTITTNDSTEIFYKD